MLFVAVGWTSVAVAETTMLALPFQVVDGAEAVIIGGSLSAGGVGERQLQIWSSLAVAGLVKGGDGDVVIGRTVER